MALKLSIDLKDASFADLVALVDAARSAGMDPRDRIDFDGRTLSLEVEVDAFFPGYEEDDDQDSEDFSAAGEETEAAEVIDRAAEDFFGPRHRDHGRPRNPWEDVRKTFEQGRDTIDFVGSSGIGDAAIRSVIDILTGRQDPPQGPRGPRGPRH
ncbi:hypothetical protein COCCU_09775 [Corynebacterium occultum]|uniref:Uncharacterized protein n=1 Tax=Corynebacterium occultum TaxID=2675219 RepID=A0A6B8VXU9_9CORY|nr:hypothetical protein [Corynebacterium occultum]QGU07879.1 hypothetical protein COCCU_09775 [Corynebacterium occultum]